MIVEEFDLVLYGLVMGEISGATAVPVVKFLQVIEAAVGDHCVALADDGFTCRHSVK